MGLVLPSGCMKADMGSQVASDSPYPSQRVKNFQPCLYFCREYLQPHSNHRPPSHWQSFLPVRVPPQGWQHSPGGYARPGCRLGAIRPRTSHRGVVVPQLFGSTEQFIT